MTNTLVLEHLFSLKNKLMWSRRSPAFAERALILESALQGVNVPIMRSTGAPLYLTDLGVRKMDDPKIFYVEHCKLANIDVIDPAALSACIAEIDLARLQPLLDAVLLFFGDYQACVEGLSARFDQIINSRQYSLLIEAGVCFAACSLEQSIPLFEKAAECAPDRSLEYAALHRLAATLIKRLGEKERGVKLLQTFFRDDDAPTDDYLSDNALLDNLLALGEFMDGDIEKASALLNSAESHMKQLWGRDSVDSGLMSRTHRYAGQVAINAAQLFSFRGDYRSAIQILLSNLKRYGGNAPEYLAEAFGSLAYACYLDTNYKDAIRYSEIGFMHYYYIGGIQGMRMCRKFAAASMYKIGDLKQANGVFRLMDSDPLGFDGFMF